VPWPLHIEGVVPPAGFSLRVPILMYHRIVPQALAGDSLPGLVVSPTLFAQQLAALRAAGWRTVTVAQLAAALQHGESLPPRTFAISIDDGWADGYTYALPILQRLGDVATFYVISDRLHDPRFLSPADLRVLAADGMEIGDHTASHLEVTGLTAQTLHAQVMNDAVAIAAILGERPATFAYPSGRFDAAAIGELSRDGFGLAVTTAPGRTEDWADRFTAPRVRVGPGTSPAGLLLRLDLGVSFG
jgi:peptidoglycan/xylan/chitin deacetylase (PgdA/CDA1 family)